MTGKVMGGAAGGREDDRAKMQRGGSGGGRRRISVGHEVMGKGCKRWKGGGRCQKRRLIGRFPRALRGTLVQQSLGVARGLSSEDSNKGCRQTSTAPHYVIPRLTPPLHVGQQTVQPQLWQAVQLW